MQHINIIFWCTLKLQQRRMSSTESVGYTQSCGGKMHPQPSTYTKRNNRINYLEVKAKIHSNCLVLPSCKRLARKKCELDKNTQLPNSFLLLKGYRMLLHSKCRIQIRTNHPNEKFTNAINEQWRKCIHTMHILAMHIYGGGSGRQSSSTKNNTWTRTGYSVIHEHHSE